MKHKARHATLRKHIDKGLRRRIFIYFIISVVLLLIIYGEIILELLSPLVALAAIFIGTILGIVASRMFHLSWDHDAKKVIARIDILGGVILAAYILFSIYRTQIIGHFVHQSIGGATLALVGGLMLGQVIGTRGKILQLLQEQKIFRK